MGEEGYDSIYQVLTQQWSKMVVSNGYWKTKLPALVSLRLVTQSTSILIGTLIVWDPRNDYVFEIPGYVTSAQFRPPTSKKFFFFSKSNWNDFRPMPGKQVERVEHSDMFKLCRFVSISAF